MRAKAKVLWALLLVLLCLSAHLQGVGGRGGGGRSAVSFIGAVVRSKKARHRRRHHHHQPRTHTYSAPTPTPSHTDRGRGLNWMIPRATATFAAAALVW
jgi:hypothetical protein